MSDIIVHEQQILKAEETRVTLRNNLRDKGVECSDDETIDSLASKVLNINAPKDLVNKQITEYIDSDLINLTIQYFTDCYFLQKVYLPKLANITTSNVFTNSDLSGLYLPSLTTFTGSGLVNSSNNLQKMSLPQLSTTSPNSIACEASRLTMLDIGNVSRLKAAVPYRIYATINACPVLKYLVLRYDVLVVASNGGILDDTPFKTSTGNAKLYVPQSLVGQYSQATNWSTLFFTEISLEGSRFEETDWLENCNSKCTLDGNEIEVLDNETVAIFKHTENISHVYEDGVELQDTDLVKDRTLTTTI